MNIGHWATVDRLLNAASETGTKARMDLLPPWISGEDQMRVAAYDLYEAIYWAVPESFRLKMRGQEGDPIYIPSGRKIVDTAQRYMAPGLSIVELPDFGTVGEQSDAHIFMFDFIRRERLLSKFSSAKFKGVMRGDWTFHVIADGDRPEGSRVSIFPLHPGTYFPEEKDDSIIAVKLVEPTLINGQDAGVNVLEYRKVTETGGPSPITVHSYTSKADEWGQPGTDMAFKTVFEEPEFTLPSPIDAIPVYHFPNVYDPEFGWGSSEMRGVERMMLAINQGISDEEVALVLEGLGVYTTTAGAPVDENDEDIAWTIAPGRVIELPSGSDFNRVSGVGSLQPYVDHLKYLHQQLEETVGNNDVTAGRVDVSVAESGIALTLRMGPLLSRMEEKELVITDVMTQLLFDLRNWFSAFEPLTFDNVRWAPVYKDKLPVNRESVFNQVLKMLGATPVPIISTKEARRMLTEVGFKFSTDDELLDQIVEEQTKLAGANADMVASRIAAGVVEEPVVPAEEEV